MWHIEVGINCVLAFQATGVEFTVCDLKVHGQPSQRRDGRQLPVQGLQQQHFLLQNFIVFASTVRDIGELSKLGWVDFLERIVFF